MLLPHARSRALRVGSFLVVGGRPEREDRVGLLQLCAAEMNSDIIGKAMRCAVNFCMMRSVSHRMGVFVLEVGLLVSRA